MQCEDYTGIEGRVDLDAALIKKKAAPPNGAMQYTDNTHK
jgi:hypothetical protein